MRVELDIFSGRPNPHWELDARDGGELLRLQAELKLAGQAPPQLPGLGYRGFSWVDEAGPCRAFRGLVTTGTSTLADPELSIERFLLDRLPDEFASLRDDIRASLAESRS